MKTKTNVTAGGTNVNHNERLTSGTSAAGLKVRTNVKAGIIRPPLGNHNERLNSTAGAAGLKARTNVKAGGTSINHNERLIHA
jgi:hypothetical protein